MVWQKKKSYFNPSVLWSSDRSFPDTSWNNTKDFGHQPAVTVVLWSGTEATQPEGEDLGAGSRANGSLHSQLVSSLDETFGGSWWNGSPPKHVNSCCRTLWHHQGIAKTLGCVTTRDRGGMKGRCFFFVFLSRGCLGTVRAPNAVTPFWPLGLSWERDKWA